MSRPLRSTPTPASRRFTATTSRSADERRVGTQCLRCDSLGTLPLAILRTCDPDRHIDARLLTFRARAANQARAASNAGHRLARTRAPARLIPSGETTLGFDAISPFRRLNDDAQPTLGPDALERLPDPHLARSSPAFSLNAHHDGLQPTQLQGGLASAPVGRHWRASNPPSLAQHRLCEGSSTRSLPQRS